MLLIKGRRESGITTLLTSPPYQRKAGLSMRRTIPLLGTMALTLLVASGVALAAGVGSAAADSTVVGTGRVHPEGDQRCRSGRHDHREGSSPRGRDNPQERDKAARRRRRDRNARRSQGRLALLEGFQTDGYLRPWRLEPRNLRDQRRRERCERFWLHDPGLQLKVQGRVTDRRYLHS